MSRHIDTRLGAPDRQGNGGAVLVVIGMHRSGTSAVTGALRCLGVRLGRRLYAGHDNINAKGYFEHSDIADANDDALLALGSAWDDILPREHGWWTRDVLKSYALDIHRYIRRDFSDGILCALKDPRIARLLPWWLEILDGVGMSPHFLFVVRSPDEVCRSLAMRDGFSPEKSVMLWLLHYMEAEQHSRGRPRAFVMYDHLIGNPERELARVGTQLGISFPIDAQEAAPCLRRFVSRELRHHREGEAGHSESELFALAYELERRLRREIPSPHAAMCVDDLWLRLEALTNQFDSMLVEQIRAMSLNRGHLQLIVRRVMRSWYWRIGKPLRVLERLCGRDV